MYVTILGIYNINAYNMIYIIYKIYTIHTNINMKYTHWRVRARVRYLLWCQEDKVCRVECINRIVEQDLHGKKCTPKIEPRTEQLTLRDERKKHTTKTASQSPWYFHKTDIIWTESRIPRGPFVSEPVLWLGYDARRTL